MLRSPDFRLGGLQSEILRAHAPFEHHIDKAGRGLFVYALRGDFVLEIDDSSLSPIDAPQGTAVGFENGRPHTWRPAPGKARVVEDAASELFVSSISGTTSLLRGLKDGFVTVPPNLDPFASVIRSCVDIFLSELSNRPAGDDDGVVRRCAEICLIQFVRYLRSQIAAQPDLPAGLAHDEFLLRAWTAYFGDPRRRWTVQALADAAGLSRTNFAERFRRVFGAPPLQTLTAMRLENAETMLRQTKAPLIEIAFAIGYNSEAAFVRAFHRGYGMPPGRFRHEHATTNQNRAKFP